MDKTDNAVNIKELVALVKIELDQKDGVGSKKIHPFSQLISLMLFLP